MSKIRRFEDLEALKLTREITKEIYRVTKNDLFMRDYGLCSQICRAAVSVMSNIAEGFERDGDKEFINFLSIAKGSIGEFRSQLYVAFDQNYISESEFKFISEKVTVNSRINSGLINYLKHSDLKGRKYKT
jgi:four helix bundle protein